MMQWFREPMLCTPIGVSVKPSAANSRTAAARSRTAITAWSTASGGKRPEKALGRLVADDAQPGNLPPRGVEEDDARRPEKREALEQRAMRLVARRHVGLQEQHAVELGAHARIGEGELFHLLARHAPVGIEVEHRRPGR